jgi:hypothetical protein
MNNKINWTFIINSFQECAVRCCGHQICYFPPLPHWPLTLLSYIPSSSLYYSSTRKDVVIPFSSTLHKSQFHPGSSSHSAMAMTTSSFMFCDFIITRCFLLLLRWIFDVSLVYNSIFHQCLTLLWIIKLCDNRNLCPSHIAMAVGDGNRLTGQLCL